MKKAKVTYRDSPVSLMYRSGAKGGMTQIGQLGGMRGLLQSMGDSPLPNIVHNFREGISPLEFIAGSDAGRKTMCDKKLGTAPAGAFTRNMVEAAYRVVVTKHDCRTGHGFELRDYAWGKGLLDALKRAIKGDDDESFEISGCMELERRTEGRSRLTSGRYRSVLTCATSPPGVCAKCYGKDLSTSRLPAVGTPVGVIAGQTIGERGTQLSMRTFHTGGVQNSSAVEGFRRMEELLNLRPVDVPLFSLKRQLNQAPDIVDGWSLFLRCFRDAPVSRRCSHLKSVPWRGGELAAYAKLRLSELEHPKEIRDILLLEGHLIYDGSIHERHFEVLLRAIQGTTVKASDPACPQVLLGLERTAIEQPSFLAAAAYRSSLQVLARAAMEGREDELAGLKERLMLGVPGPACKEHD